MKKLFQIISVLFLLWSGSAYAECIQGNCQNGQGTFTFSSGAKYVGEYKDGKRNGQGTFTFPDGRVKKGIWKNSELVKPN